MYTNTVEQKKRLSTKVAKVIENKNLETIFKRTNLQFREQSQKRS